MQGLKIMSSKGLFETSPRETRKAPEVIEVAELPDGTFIDHEVKGHKVNVKVQDDHGLKLSQQANNIPASKRRPNGTSADFISPAVQPALVNTTLPLNSNLDVPAPMPKAQSVDLLPGNYNVTVPSGSVDYSLAELVRLLREKIEASKGTGQQIEMFDKSTGNVITNWAFRISSEI